jgi:hypothetical protein
VLQLLSIEEVSQHVLQVMTAGAYFCCLKEFDVCIASALPAHCSAVEGYSAYTHVIYECMLEKHLELAPTPTSVLNLHFWLEGTNATPASTAYLTFLSVLYHDALQRPEDCRRCHALLHQRGLSHHERYDFAPAINLRAQLDNSTARPLLPTAPTDFPASFFVFCNHSTTPPQRPEDCRRCHALLHQRGLSHYERHNFSPAINLLTAAVFFSTSLTVGKSARLLAMSLAKAQQPQRALQYIGLAEQQEGCTSALGCLIRLQVQLAQQQQQQHVKQSLRKDEKGAPAAATNREDATVAAAAAASAEDCVAAVEALSSCTDFNKTTMQVRC